MLFKRIEKKLDEIQRQPNELERQLDELLESLSKNSAVVDSLAKDKLKKAHIIISYAIDTSRDAAFRGLDYGSAPYYVATEMFKQLRTAQKLIGEVIGEGGAKNE